jgi:hypothetical protein
MRGIIFLLLSNNTINEMKKIFRLLLIINLSSLNQKKPVESATCGGSYLLNNTDSFHRNHRHSKSTENLNSLLYDYEKAVPIITDHQQHYYDDFQDKRSIFNRSEDHTNSASAFTSSSSSAAAALRASYRQQNYRNEQHQLNQQQQQHQQIRYVDETEHLGRHEDQLHHHNHHQHDFKDAKIRVKYPQFTKYVQNSNCNGNERSFLNLSTDDLNLNDYYTAIVADEEQTATAAAKTEGGFAQIRSNYEGNV